MPLFTFSACYKLLRIGVCVPFVNSDSDSKMMKQILEDTFKNRFLLRDGYNLDPPTANITIIKYNTDFTTLIDVNTDPHNKYNVSYEFDNFSMIGDTSHCDKYTCDISECLRGLYELYQTNDITDLDQYGDWIIVIISTGDISPYHDCPMMCMSEIFDETKVVVVNIGQSATKSAFVEQIQKESNGYVLTHRYDSFQQALDDKFGDKLFRDICPLLGFSGMFFIKWCTFYL